MSDEEKIPVYSPSWKNLPTSVVRSSAMLRHVPLAIRRYVFKTDDYGCHYCGSQHRLSVDHKIPYSKGGTHDPENLVTACLECNVKRSAKPYEEFRASVTYCVYPRITNQSTDFAQLRARIDEIEFEQLRQALHRIQIPPCVTL